MLKTSSKTSKTHERRGTRGRNFSTDINIAADFCTSDVSCFGILLTLFWNEQTMQEYDQSTPRKRSFSFAKRHWIWTPNNYISKSSCRKCESCHCQLFCCPRVQHGEALSKVAKNCTWCFFESLWKAPKFAKTCCFLSQMLLSSQQAMEEKFELQLYDQICYRYNEGMGRQKKVTSSNRLLMYTLST